MTHISRTDQALRKGPLQILYLEDDAGDLELCLNILTRSNLDFHSDQVCTLEDFAKKLSAQTYDLVLADYRMKGWTGMDALTLLREKNMDTPFILVSGALGEEIAMECIRKGAADVILKDRLDLLPLAIHRVLDQKMVHATQERAESSLRESEQRFRRLAEGSTSAIFIYQGIDCQYVNRAAEEITGYTQEEILTVSSRELLHLESRETLIEQRLMRLQEQGGPQRFDVKILTKDGKAKWLDLTIGQVDFNGSPARLFSALDITERKLAEEEIRLQATTDHLTGLANYRRLVDSFEMEAHRSRRTGRVFSLALFDLDQLKKVNDIHGHLAGSRALCRLAIILRRNCRNIDLVARHGGDEFSVLLPETNTEGAEHFARRVCAGLSFDTEEPRLSVSSGVSAFPDDGETMDAVFSVADRALYAMKKHDVAITSTST